MQFNALLFCFITCVFIHLKYVYYSTSVVINIYIIVGADSKYRFPECCWRGTSSVAGRDEVVDLRAAAAAAGLQADATGS